MEEETKQTNLLKKSINVFGRAVPIWLIATLALSGVGGAVLIGYISNLVQLSVTVTSPMEQYIGYSTSTTNKEPLSINAKGGETVDFYVITKNNANVPIIGKPLNRVTNVGGVTCADFVSVNAKTSSDGGTTWVGPYDLIALGKCTQDGSYAVKFAYGPSPTITWDVGQTDINEIRATFKADASGTYVFSSQILP